MGNELRITDYELRNYELRNYGIITKSKEI
jgi:hypothetical protein